MHSNVIILLIIAKIWKKPYCPSTDKWTIIMNNNEFLSFATTWSSGEYYASVLGAGVRHSAHGKGHEEGGSTYAKAGSSLRSPPGNPRASTPITRACLLYYFGLSPTPLTLRGAVPHHLFWRRS